MALSKVKVDLDCENWYQLFHSRMYRIHSILGLHSDTHLYKSKGGHHHAVVEFKERLTDWQILCLQLILGSDPVRECFNFRRLIRGQHNWNILFEHEELK